MTKIFVTVGTQIPFDRLLTGLEHWLQSQQANRCEVFAQIGESSFSSPLIEYRKFIDLAEYQRRIEWCDAIVAHAGMGAILSSLEAGKPILIMPRRASLGEHRNEHQLATAERFAAMGKVVVAMNETELPGKLLTIFEQSSRTSPIGKFASEQLIQAVRHFVMDSE